MTLKKRYIIAREFSTAYKRFFHHRKYWDWVNRSISEHYGLRRTK